MYNSLVLSGSTMPHSTMTNHFQNFPSSQTGRAMPLNNFSFPPQVLVFSILFCASINLPILNTSYKWNIQIVFMCLAYFTQHTCFQGFFILWCVSEIYSFLWLNNIQLYVYPTFTYPFSFSQKFGMFPSPFVYWKCQTVFH